MQDMCSVLINFELNYENCQMCRPDPYVSPITSQSRRADTIMRVRGVDHFTVRNDTDVIKSIKNILEK